MIDDERLEALVSRLDKIAHGEFDSVAEQHSGQKFMLLEDNGEDESTDRDGVQLTLCNCPSRDEAREIARGLVESGLAACVNIIANIGSIYQWQGEIVDTSECQLQIKSAAERREAIEAYICLLYTSPSPRDA